MNRVTARFLLDLATIFRQRAVCPALFRGGDQALEDGARIVLERLDRWIDQLDQLANPEEWARHIEQLEEWDRFIEKACELYARALEIAEDSKEMTL